MHYHCLFLWLGFVNLAFVAHNSAGRLGKKIKTGTRVQTAAIYPNVPGRLDDYFTVSSSGRSARPEAPSSGCIHIQNRCVSRHFSPPFPRRGQRPWTGEHNLHLRGNQLALLCYILESQHNFLSKPSGIVEQIEDLQCWICALSPCFSLITVTSIIMTHLI